MRKMLFTCMVILMMGLLASCDAADIPEVAQKVEEVKEQIEEKKVEPDILTVDNTPTLNNIMVSANENMLVDFAKAYYNKTLEFDGTIDIAGLIPGKTSRFEMLFHSGPNDGSGTIFKIKDFAKYNDGVSEMINNNTLIAGQPIRIVASVDSYEQSTGIFYLTLKSIKSK